MVVKEVFLLAGGAGGRGPQFNRVSCYLEVGQTRCEDCDSQYGTWVLTFSGAGESYDDWAILFILLNLELNIC